MSDWKNISQILEAVSCVSGVPDDQIISRRRARPIAWARFLFVREVRSRYSWWTLQQTADALKMTGHSNVMHAEKRAGELMKSQPHFADMASRLSKKLSNTEWNLS